MKAPASMLSISMESSGRRALDTPMVSTLAAISLGEKASKPKSSDMVRPGRDNGEKEIPAARAYAHLSFAAYGS